MTSSQARPFVVFCLPRSRSAWLAHFLSYGDKLVGYDIAIECRKIGDFFESFQNGLAGTVETGSVLAWRLIREAMPEAKLVVIRRPVMEVAESLWKLGLEPPLEDLLERDAMLDTVASQPGSRSFQFHDLHSSGVCGELFEWCLGVPLDGEWWQRLDRLNIQVNIHDRIAQLTRNHSQLEALKAEVRLLSGKLGERGLGCSGLN